MLYSDITSLSLSLKTDIGVCRLLRNLIFDLVSSLSNVSKRRGVVRSSDGDLSFDSIITSLFLRCLPHEKLLLVRCVPKVLARSF